MHKMSMGRWYDIFKCVNTTKSSFTKKLCGKFPLLPDNLNI